LKHPMRSSNSTQPIATRVSRRMKLEVDGKSVGECLRKGTHARTHGLATYYASTDERKTREHDASGPVCRTGRRISNCSRSRIGVRPAAQTRSTPRCCRMPHRTLAADTSKWKPTTTAIEHYSQNSLYPIATRTSRRTNYD